MTTALLQHWFCRIRQTNFPYYYYAISNAGSLLGLLTYPFVMEYFIGISLQTIIWSTLFVVYAALLIVCLFFYILSGQQQKYDNSIVIAPKISMKTKFAWISFSFLSCTLLLSVTQYLSQNVINLPLLWVVTLGLYLVTFIVTFRKNAKYNREFWSSSWLVWSCLSLGILVFIPTYGLDLIIVLLALLYCGCMVCHGELVDCSPSSEALTEFYLLMALGGVLGGIFVNLIALMIFNTLWEFYLIIMTITVIIAWQYAIFHQRSSLSECQKMNFGIVAYSKFIAIGLLCVILYKNYFVESNTVAQIRNPYGLIQVKDISANKRALMHGRVLHGVEHTNTYQKLEPTTYYSAATGIGAIIAYLQDKHPSLSMGAIGLGIGTISAYARQSDTINFYEIDSDIIKIAKKHFHYLSSSLGKIDITLKDGRLALEQEWAKSGSKEYDVIVIDAFSGDNIPFHLLTEEAILLYQKHLKQNGTIALHVSNTYIDLEAVTLALANRINAKHCYLTNLPNDKADTIKSQWAIISHDTTLVDWLANQAISTKIGSESGIAPILWTDAKNSILSLLK